MTLTPDDESLILRGRRLVPDENSDAYFQHIADEVRKGNGNIFGIVKNAVPMFKHPPHCPGCS
jgi:hypothetical protein